jgi:class 3 adenylate cyclase/tetratricopeptide (TPR) repeat protein
MAQEDPNGGRRQLEAAIAAQESLRGEVDDEIIDAAIATLREKLSELDPTPQQRKLATILFLDIAGHTALTIDLDPEEQMEVIDAAIARMAAKIGEFGGHVTRYQGDGFKAIFGLPVAYENDPAQAIQSSLAIQTEARKISVELETERALSGFQVRIGIATGMVIAGGETEDEDTIKGLAVNLAARLENAAEPGTILISHDSYRHVRGIFDFEPLEPILVKGLSEKVAVYRVLRAKARPFFRGMRGVEGVETRMVGRELEFQQLCKLFHEVIEDNKRQMVTVVGEAGLGKSRLLYEYENWVDLQPESVEIFKVRARLETRGLAYAPIRDMFAFRYQIQDDDQAMAVREKLADGLVEAFGADPASKKKVHIIGQLLGHNFSDSPYVEEVLDDPQRLRDWALSYLSDYFRAMSDQKPILLLIEDLHWADNSSLDALKTLASELNGQQVLIIATARVALLERRPHWGEGQDFHQRVVLESLSKRESRSLVGEVLQMVNKVPGALLELVISNAEGNPFYVEELVKMLIEDGVIVPSEPSWQVEQDKLQEIQVPPTLTGVLQARLDALPWEEKAILQQASVVGRIFWDQVIERINESANLRVTDFGVADVLEDLQGKELVFRREISAFADAREHIFKHALLREVTYESVLKRERNTYHALIADWLIEHSRERENEFFGLIADHLEHAKKLERAIVYLHKAGVEAAARFANEEAISYFSRALKLAKATGVSSEKLSSLYSQLGKTLELNSQWDHAVSNYEEMEAMARNNADLVMELASLTAQTVIFSKPTPVQDPSRGKALGDKGLNLARHLQDEAAEAKILWSLLLANYFLGRESQAIEAGERSLEIARKLYLHEQLARTLNDLGGICYTYYGYLDQAIVSLDEAILLWRKLGNWPMLMDSLTNLCNAHVFIGNYERAILLSKEARQISLSINNLWGQSYCQYLVGRAYWERGEISQAISVMQESIHIGDLAGFIASPTFTQSDLAILYGSLGALDLAFEIAEKASGLAEKIGAVVYTQGVLARLNVMRGDLLRAEACIKKAKGPIQAIQGQFPLHNLVPPTLAEVELALEKGNFEDALAAAEAFLTSLRQYGFRFQIPRGLYLQAHALLGLGHTQVAYERLLEAQFEAKSINSRWMLWHILVALSRLETKSDEVDRLRFTARELVAYITNHIDQIEIREKFINLPDVRDLIENI